MYGIYLFKYTCMKINILIWKFRFKYTQWYIQVYIYTYIFIYTYIYLYNYIYIYIYLNILRFKYSCMKIKIPNKKSKTEPSAYSVLRTKVDKTLKKRKRWNNHIIFFYSFLLSFHKLLLWFNRFRMQNLFLWLVPIKRNRGI